MEALEDDHVAVEEEDKVDYDAYPDVARHVLEA
jgi:hypothetical protein